MHLHEDSADEKDLCGARLDMRSRAGPIAALEAMLVDMATSSLG